MPRAQGQIMLRLLQVHFHSTLNGHTHYHERTHRPVHTETGLSQAWRPVNVIYVCNPLLRIATVNI